MWGPEPTPGSNHRKLKLVLLNFQYRVSLASFIVTIGIGCTMAQITFLIQITNQLIKPVSDIYM